MNRLRAWAAPAAALALSLATVALATQEDRADTTPKQRPTAASPLSQSVARRALEAALSSAGGGANTGAIAVVDAAGDLVAFERLDGTFPASVDVSIGKARTAARFRKPTSQFEDIIRGGRTPMLALEGFTPLQGGVPILVDGVVIGAVGVSGAASAMEDETIAQAGADAVGGVR